MPKALKTELGTERLRLERAERIFAAVTLMSVVASQLSQGPRGQDAGLAHHKP